jgi:ATP-dependent Clp protease protease subunit
MNRSPFRRAQAKLRVALTDTEAEILLYSEISEWWGIGAETFKRELDAITTPTINLRINSPGGDVFDSYAIYNALVAHPARIITHIDGVAASMASIIALAGDEVRMAENAFFMVHNPWSIVMGNADALRKEAGLLEKIGGTMADTYRERTGATAEEVAAWMDDETWFTAEEAKAAGFVDSIQGKPKDDAAPAALFDLSVFANAPAALTEPLPDPTIRDLEHALRDAGMSQIAAKQFVSAGRAAALQRDVAEAGERDVTPRPVRFTVPIGF